MNALTICLSRLLQEQAVTSKTNARIFAVLAPQKLAMTRPQVILNLISNLDTVTLGGAGEYFRSVVQVDCNADTVEAAIELGDAVIGCLNGVVKATVGSAGDVDILLGDTDFTEFEELAKAYRRVIQFYVRWRVAS